MDGEKSHSEEGIIQGEDPAHAAPIKYSEIVRGLARVE